MTSTLGSTPLQQPAVFAFDAGTQQHGPAFGAAFPNNPFSGPGSASTASAATMDSAGAFPAGVPQPVSSGSMPAGAAQTPRRLNRRVHRHRSQVAGAGGAAADPGSTSPQPASSGAEPDQAPRSAPVSGSSFQAAFRSLPPCFARAMDLNGDAKPEQASAPSSNPFGFASAPAGVQQPAMAPGSARKKAPRSARKATAGASFGASSPVASSGFPAGASLFPGGQGTPFTFREGSPMDWSPFEAATAAPFQSVENSFQSSITRASGSGLAGRLGAKLRFGAKVAPEAGGAAATDRHAQRSPDPPAGRSKQAQAAAPAWFGAGEAAEAEDPADGLHSDLAAASLDGESKGAQHSLAAEFSARFGFAEGRTSTPSFRSATSEVPDAHELDSEPDQDAAAAAAPSADAREESVPAEEAPLGVRPSGSSAADQQQQQQQLQAGEAPREEVAAPEKEPLASFIAALHAQSSPCKPAAEASGNSAAAAEQSPEAGQEGGGGMSSGAHIAGKGSGSLHDASMADSGSGGAGEAAGDALQQQPDEATSPLKPNQAEQARAAAQESGAAEAAPEQQPGQAPSVGAKPGAGFTLGAFGKLHGRRQQKKRAGVGQAGAPAAGSQTAGPAAVAAEPEQAPAAGAAWRSYAGEVRQQALAAAAPFGAAAGAGEGAAGPQPFAFGAAASSAAGAQPAAAPDQAAPFSFGSGFRPAQAAPAAAPKSAPQRSPFRQHYMRHGEAAHQQRPMQTSGNAPEQRTSQPSPPQPPPFTFVFSQQQQEQSSSAAGSQPSSSAAFWSSQPAAASTPAPEAAPQPGFHAASSAAAPSFSPAPGAEPFRFRSASQERCSSPQQQTADDPASQAQPKSFASFKGFGAAEGAAPEKAGLSASEADPAVSNPFQGFQGFSAGRAVKRADASAFINRGAATPKATSTQRGSSSVASSGDGRPRRRFVRPAAPEQAPPPPPPEQHAPGADDVHQGGGAPEAFPQRAPPAEEDVERLRQRGNDAFARGSYTRAADLYQRAVQLLAAGSPSAPGLGKLHSNLAAAFLQLERPHAALAACRRAIEAEPGFAKARVRLATCHMRLGRFRAALAALQPPPDQALPAAPELAAKREEVHALQARFTQALAAAEGAGSQAEAQAALGQVEALLVSDGVPFSGRALAARARLLLQLRRRAQSHLRAATPPPESAYCSHAVESHILLRKCSVETSAILLACRLDDAAEMCAACSVAKEPGQADAHAGWTWWVAAQCAFHAGDLASAAAQLEARLASHGAAEGGSGEGIPIGAPEEEAAEQGEGAPPETVPAAELQALAAGMCELVSLKDAGNRAMKAGQAAQALGHYSAALAAAQPGSAAFAAVLHANRAAAQQALGAHVAAVSDCLRATALDPGYAKAHSRLAALLMELGHGAGAGDALAALAALPACLGSPGAAADARRRLAEARAAERRGGPDPYRMLSLARRSSAEEVRRAYKKAALALHPDKALAHCRFAHRMGPAGAKLAAVSQIEERARANADWLFKCVAGAAAVLGDAAQRAELDADLDARAKGRPVYGGGAYYARTSGGYGRRPRGGHAGSYYRPGRWDAPPGAGAQQNPSAGFGARWTGGPPSQSDESDSEEGSRPFY